MRNLRRSSLVAVAFVALMAAPAAATSAMSPGYVSSDPEHEEMLDEAPELVEVTFDEPLDMSSDLTVKDECGRTVDDGDVQVEANILRVGIALTPRGHYYVTYSATGVGGVTGTENAGFNFMVHNGAPCGDGAHEEGHGGEQGGDGGGGHGGGGSHDGGGDSRHPGSGHSSGGTDHSSMDQSGGTDHSSMDQSGGTDHSSMDQSGGKHATMNHGKSKHGGGHGGKHDILEKNKAKADDAPIAAGAGGPLSPDGQAVMLALALSLMLGALGGWFLRVSGRR